MTRSHIKTTLEWLTITAVAVLLGIVIIGKAHAELIFPDRGNQAVVDSAHVLTSTTTQELSNVLTQWEHQTHHQMVVVTVPDLQGTDIADYSYQLGRKWKLGRTGIDDDILLLYSANPRKVRLEVGKGMEVVLTDAMSKQFTDQIAHEIKTVNVSAGMVLGTRLVTNYVNSHEADVRQSVKPVKTSSMAWLWYAVLFLVGISGLRSWWLMRNPKKVKSTSSQPPAPSGQSQYSELNQYYPPRYSPSYPTSNRTLYRQDRSSAPAASPIIPVVIPDDDDDTRSSYSSGSSSSNDDSSSDSGFSSSNSDYDNFSGGGADSDC